MKKRNFNKIFIMIIICVFASFFPNKYDAASDYNSSFKILKYDYETHGTNVDSSWNTEYYQADTEAVLANDVLDSDESLKPGEYYLIGITLNYTGSSTTGPARAASLYYQINTDLFEIIRDDEMEMDISFDMRTINEGGIFPYHKTVSRRWQPDYDAAVVNNGLVATLLETGSASYPQYFSSNMDQPFAFVLVKLKDTATPGESITFNYLNDIYNGTETIYTNDDYDGFPIDTTPLTTSVYKEEKLPSKDVTVKSVKATYNGVDYLGVIDLNDDHTYNIIVPNGASSVTIAVEPNDPNASVETKSYVDPQSLNIGNNNYTFSIRAEDTSISLENYNIVIKRIDTNADLKSLTLTDVSGFTFDPTTTSYTGLTVPYKTTKTTITATLPTNSTATIKSGVGEWNLTNIGSSTKNIKKIIVESESCKDEYKNISGNSCISKEYSLEIERLAADTDSSLKSLEVKTSSTGSAYTITPTFEPGMTGEKNYTVTVPFETSSVYIDAVATSSLIVGITGDKNITLNGNTTTANVIVTAEDNSTSTYKITINKELSNDNTLSSITLNGTTITGFNKDNVGPYDLGNVNGNVTNIGTGINNLNIEATPTNGYATVVRKVNGSTTGTFIDGKNTITYEVTAQDGGTAKVYTLEVYRKSSNANLQNLTVSSTPQGTLNPSSFNVNTKTYTYTYDEKVTDATITATKGENHQTITDNGIIVVNPKTQSSVTITVTAEDGTTNTYTVNFAKKTSTDNTINKIELKYDDASGIEQVVTLTKNGNTYSATVPYEAEIVNLEVTPNSESASINPANGPWTLTNTGSTLNTKTVTVTAESNAQATYTINVTRTPSNNNYLSDLKISGTTINDFIKTKEEYRVDDVKSTVGSLNITYTTENKDATAQIVSPTNNLQTGDNTVIIRVTAEDGTTRDYKIKVKKLSGIAALNTLTITSSPQGAYTPALSDKETTYIYKYDRTVTNINVTASAKNNGTVTGEGNFDPSVTSNIKLTVTAEDTDITKEITIKFEQIKETETKLTSITVTNKTDGTNYTLTPTFSESNVGPYNITVPAEVEKVEISATPKGSYTKNIEGIGDKSLTPGSNPITITVTAENDDTKTYTLNITREFSVTLIDLKADDKQVPEFSPGKPDYDLGSFDYDKTTLKLEGITSPGSTVTGDGMKNLDVGNNTFTITVTAADGITKGNYTIKARRKSNDSSISNITTNVAGATVKSTGTNEYTIDIPTGTTNITLIPSLTHAQANIIEDESIYTNIDLTTTSELTLNIQAEDTNTNYNTVYKIKLNVLKSTNAYLANLTTNIGSLNPSFDKTKDKYTIEVENNITSIDLTATPEISTSEVSATLNTTAVTNTNGTFSINLEPGKNIVVFTVTAEDKTTTKSYTVEVTRKKKNIASLEMITIDGVDLPGFLPSNTGIYSYTVSEDKTNIEIGVTKTDIDSTVTGEGKHELTSSATIINIEVTAQDGITKKTYTITINKANPDSLELNNLSVTDHGLNPAIFLPSIDSYAITNVTNDTDSFNIVATTSNPNATIKYQLNDETPTTNPTIDVTGIESGTIKVIVSEGSASKTYTLEFNKIDLSTLELDDLSVTGHTLTPEFSSNIDSYNINDVSNTTNTLEIVASLANPNAVIKYQLNDEAITENSNIDVTGIENGTIKVIVTESNTSKIYTLTFSKTDIPVGLDKITSDKKDDGSDIHTLDDDYVLTGRPALTSSDFKDEFINEKLELHIYKDGAEIAETDNITTGMTIKLERNGKVLDQKDIVIKADVVATGSIDLLDANRIVNHFLGTDTLTGAYEIAGNVNGQGPIDLVDANMIVNHFLGSVSITW